MLRPAAISGALLVCMAGCFRPDLRDCTVSCASNKDCIGGQVCNHDGLCVRADFSGSCGSTADARVTTMKDAAGDSDAVALCMQGCTNGTCDANGVCVIDCSQAYSCDSMDVLCPANLPCHVICGDHACMHHVQCGYSRSCQVDCNGTAACGDVIQCNTGPCKVSCTGDMSCHRHTECSMSCACDVSCTGSGSCGDVSKCPLATACILGRGCSSQLPGCDSCP